MTDATDPRMEAAVKMFGQDSSVRATWVSTVTHGHEQSRPAHRGCAQQHGGAALEQMAGLAPDYLVIG